MRMSRKIYVEQVTRTPVEEQQIELVERKGVGHPDSLADGMADAISRELCRAYMKEFGVVLHHNTDQVEVVGGKAEVDFGRGEVVKPIYVLLSGRATMIAGDRVVPVHRIAMKAARDYLSRTLRNINVEGDVILDSRIGQGSTDLIDVFTRSKEMPLANDTSFGVGFAPLSDVERLCYTVERELNSDAFKERYPESGEDIKVMGLREGDRIVLTISVAMIARKVPDIDHYISVVDDIKEEVERIASGITEREVEVNLNTGDDYERKAVYLTATGTSAEMGDDGSVGRGNRVNGLITPNRHMSMEAAAGKNPVNHVGKIYNLLAPRIAQQVAEEVAGVKEVYVRLLSQIGRPIDQPRAASVQLILEEGTSLSSIQQDVHSIVDENLANIRRITELFIKGELTTF